MLSEDARVCPHPLVRLAHALAIGPMVVGLLTVGLGVALTGCATDRVPGQDDDDTVDASVVDLGSASDGAPGQRDATSVLVCAIAASSRLRKSKQERCSS